MALAIFSHNYNYVTLIWCHFNFDLQTEGEFTRHLLRCQAYFKTLSECSEDLAGTALEQQVL